MKPRVSLRESLTDPALLGSALAGESWKPWRTLLIASMGEALTDEERTIFKQFTGREQEPGMRVDELAVIAGRRGGKSRALAVLAVYIAALCDHPLVAGERGVLLLIAPDQKQARISLEYASAAFEFSPILAQLVERQNSDTIELRNVSIE